MNQLYIQIKLENFMWSEKERGRPQLGLSNRSGWVEFEFGLYINRSENP